jgi:hypothetical protein
LTKRAGKLDSGAEGWRLMMVQKEIEVFETTAGTEKD